ERGSRGGPGPRRHRAHVPWTVRDGGSVGMSPAEFVQQLVNALSLGSIYSMLFASHLGAPFVVMALVGIAAATVASVLMELIAFRPLRNASFMTLLFTSFAVSQLIENVLRQAISPRPKGVPVPDLFDNAIRLGPITIGLLPLITAGVGVVSLYGLTLFLRRSRAGLSMRAASQDFTTARLVGVRANRVISLAFAISGVLAGIAGVLWISRTTAV